MKHTNFSNNSAMVFLSCLLLWGTTTFAATKIVTTVVGGYIGDGKPATSAAFANPVAVARDAKGNLYLSDSNNCRIRRINVKGFISTFAGTGICGYSGDGGRATSAMMSGPAGLTFDAKGNLLFADQGNSRIRKITPDGTISTIAGNGTRGYSGNGGPATKAKLAYPSSVSVDANGKVYIADYANYVIRMVDTAGIIHRVAGNHTAGFGGDGGPATSAQLQYVYDVLADTGGNFYIADQGNDRVRKVDASGKITTFAGNGISGNKGSGGPATQASIGFVMGLGLGNGNLYISAGSNVWAVDLSTQIINIIAGNASGLAGFNGDGGPALSAELLNPWGLSFDAAGNLLIADSGNNRIRRIDASQTITTIAGGYLGDGHLAISASLNISSAGEQMAFDGAGNLYIADSNNNRIRKVSATGVITTVAGTGVNGYSGDGGPAVAATLNAPSAVAVDKSGNIFIADTNNFVIRKVDISGTITSFSVNPGVCPQGMALDSSGDLYTGDWCSNVIWKITPGGSASIFAGMKWQYGYNGDGIPATQATVYFPTAVVFDAVGNLYITDWLNQRIRKVDASGIITTVAGNGLTGFTGDGGPATAATLNFPRDAVVDAKSNLYIADWVNFRVRVVDPSGTINTYAGTGNWGYTGNNLPATSTNMLPVAVTVNSNGAVYVSDESSDRVRKIH